jgi:hypothetical protein
MVVFLHRRLGEERRIHIVFPCSILSGGSYGVASGGFRDLRAVAFETCLETDAGDEDGDGYAGA